MHNSENEDAQGQVEIDWVTDRSRDPKAPETPGNYGISQVRSVQ